MSRAIERSTITTVLRRIDLKVRFNQTLRHLSVATCLVLGVLLLIEVAPLLVPVSVPSGGLIVAAGSAAFTAFLLWSQIGGRQLERAAGVADLRAALNGRAPLCPRFLSRFARAVAASLVLPVATPFTETGIDRAGGALCPLLRSGHSSLG